MKIVSKMCLAVPILISYHMRYCEKVNAAFTTGVNRQHTKD